MPYFEVVSTFSLSPVSFLRKVSNQRDTRRENSLIMHVPCNYKYLVNRHYIIAL